MLKPLPVKLPSILASAAVALGVALGGCSQSSETSSREKPLVVASYSVLCDLTTEIAQDTIDMACLIEPGQDPHTYKATTLARQSLEQAQLVLYGGYDFEPEVIKLVQATNTPAPKIAVHDQAVPSPIMAEAHHHDDHEQEKDDHKDHHKDHHDDHHDHEEEKTGSAHSDEELEPDPHIWHDVQNGIKMAEVIRSQLAALNPDDQELYAKNAKQLTTELEQLDAWVKAQVATIPKGQRQLITTHDALGYYINAYGFSDSDALQGLSAEEAPTAARVKELVQKIKKSKVPTIFAEVTTNDKVIGTVAREAKVKLSDQKLFADGLGEKGSDTGTYIGMITSNTCAIVDGLGGNCSSFAAKAAK
ncbi:MULTISPECIES: zinc ABC transporter substrate-binding protein [Moorena]|uniref:ABC-type metal ion transport system, periplasmic component/surface adhesin n=1 Tax=Moorena producens 3L TaxID=489825 RepID=F4XTG3_9CYAN|nr:MULTISPECIES: zinc ABC transporter substrate-binding protein [Moorena]EGJ32099.1 ABC-type metal ion transport system, periplasmic component/surface adhesin [Moorena producens 3L]NEP36136.1 zinc ABC transporter solute-binding protein [Moorena sp. SIO3B2]NEP64630.1 zinc ABC transporter solute-binding protein [Moorena sp. SIO3A5]NER85898.1 zinc ABC transporter solute-binding protein [Moorena sp. SIO3A2]NES41760.1 zinc ABC transporter solute-binding protein [Moorena sp. SIO2C4]